ncbi:MAG: hypothetical protein FWB98_01580 [Defluviitaleaceae bacterium]|nr:hypothetical protein [Defluviitaleaceae bacterium]
MLSLIRFNIAGYTRSAKYLPGLVLFTVFLGFNYQTAPVDIWGNLHLTSIAIFILATTIAATLVASEDATQQQITLLHTKNETKYHISKILSAVIFLVPFYIVTSVLPVVFGVFPRHLTIIEILTHLSVYFLVGLLGVTLGVFFNFRIFRKETAFAAHIAFVAIIAIPLNVIFSHITVLEFVYYILPPIHFLAEDLNRLSNASTLPMTGNFLVFTIICLAYSTALAIIYCLVMSNRMKQ